MNKILVVSQFVQIKKENATIILGFTSRAKYLLLPSYIYRILHLFEGNSVEILYMWA